MKITRRTILSATTAITGTSLFPPLTAQPADAVSLPKLPYATDALEPYIDAKTMEIHHSKHHQAYVDNLNKALAAHPSLSGKPVEKLVADLASVPESIRTAIRNNGGGHLNHSLFWQILSNSKSTPKDKLKSAIDRSFGNHVAFEDKLKTAGLAVFGSGWVWAVPQGKDGISIETSPNQDSPWMLGKTPLFGLDVWEHAYYLKYQNRRADYLAALVQVMNWDYLSQRYEEISN